MEALRDAERSSLGRDSVMNRNAWRYWRPVMWWVSRQQRKTKEAQHRIQKLKNDYSYVPLMQFVYPVIPRGYDTRYKFIRRAVGIDGTTGKIIPGTECLF